MKFAPQETQEIRAAVFERQGGKCAICGAQATELDHFFGRKVQQTEWNCWALCTECHALKTANHPTALRWTERFQAYLHMAALLHDSPWGDDALKLSVDAADRRVDWLRAKAKLNGG